MMICTEYRRRLLTDPGHPIPEMRAHVASCHDCTQYTERALRFEGCLERALRVTLGGPAVGRGTGREMAMGRVGWQPGLTWRRRRRGLAIAASMLLAIFCGGFVWLVAPGRSLAAAVVNHMAGEPASWARTDAAVPEPNLDAVMTASGAHLRPSAGLVSYVHSCEFRGHQVPHLVVQTPAGPVTVMVLVQESVRRGVRFDEEGYRGMIVPIPDHGSLAVLERIPDADPKTIDAVASRVLAALDWK